MTWALANLGLIWGRTLDHIVLSLPPIVLCFVIAVPLGWLARRYTISRGVILTGAGLLYAVPSLPLFFVLPAVIGTGLRSPLNVIIALTLYGVYDDSGPAEPLFEQLGPHSTGKGCLYLKRLDAVDSAVLERLIRSAWERA